MTFVLIALGGAAGALTRYAVDTWVTERVPGTFPWGTFIVNLSGSLVIGIVVGAAIEREVLPAVIRPLVVVGFLGAYTTFSTYSLDTWRLIEAGATIPALANLIGSAALGVLAVVVGLSIGRALA